MSYSIEVTANSESSLRTAIATAASTGQEVLIPPGTYTLTQPIEVSHISGLKLRGAGMGNPGSWPGATIITAGAAYFDDYGATPLLTLVGVIASRFQGIQFKIPEGSIGIRINTDDPGFPAGGIRFEQCFFTSVNSAAPAIAGIVVGDTVEETNNDTCVFEQCIFQHLQFGVVFNNDQAVLHRFQNCSLGYCEIGVHAAHGGNMMFSSCDFGANDICVRIDYGGVNASGFTFVGCRHELRGKSKDTGTFVLADADNVGGTILINAIGNSTLAAAQTEEANPYPYVFTLGGRSAARVMGHTYSPLLNVAKTSNNATFYDSDSTFVEFKPTTAGKTSGKNIVIERPVDQDGKALKEKRPNALSVIASVFK